jgi:hypothetical protein
MDGWRSLSPVRRFAGGSGISNVGRGRAAGKEEKTDWRRLLPKTSGAWTSSHTPAWRGLRRSRQAAPVARKATDGDGGAVHTTNGRRRG